MPRTIPRAYDTVLWRRLRRQVLARDGYRCHWCGARADTVDHLRAVEEGGKPYWPGNLVAACKPCNSSRGAEVLKAKSQGVFLGSRRAIHPLSPITDSVREREQIGAIRV